jgi:hypothetical protein
VAALILLGLAACSRPPGIEGCATLSDTVAREECRYTEAKAVFDDDKKLHAVLAAIPDDASRDLLLSRLAVDHPARAPALCAQMKTAPFRENCDRVIGRPHLAGAP